MQRDGGWDAVEGARGHVHTPLLSSLLSPLATSLTPLGVVSVVSPLLPFPSCVPCFYCHVFRFQKLHLLCCLGALTAGSVSGVANIPKSGFEIKAAAAGWKTEKPEGVVGRLGGL